MKSEEVLLGGQKMTWGWEVEPKKFSQEYLDQIYALNPIPVEQSRRIDLLQFIKTRFVTVEKHNELVTKLMNEIYHLKEGLQEEKP